jgi:hypothetical protein
MMTDEQLLEKIGTILQELDAIYERAFRDGQTDLGWELLERLKRRVSRLLGEEVSEEEALAFQLPLADSPFTDLGDDIERCKNKLGALAEELRSHPEVRTRRRTGMSPTTTVRATTAEDVLWDLFICHASEDKEPFVRQLAEATQADGLRVWYDEFTLKVGDSLRRSIDRGLASSRFGVVVLSPHFFAKDWPQRELDGLMAREIDGRKVILPIWHNIEVDEIRQYSPLLADRVAAKSSDGLGVVVQRLLQAIR